MYKFLLILFLLMSVGSAQLPYYFPPTGSSFGETLNSYGFPPSDGYIANCYFETRQMEQYYNSLGYNTQIAYDSSASQSGHIYLMVQNPGSIGWAAVDPYYGYVPSPSSYYTPDQVYPTWQAFDNSIPRTRISS